MKKLYIGSCLLKVRKEYFEKFITDLYMRFYKKERLRHVTRKDKRLPHIKVTSDIFSLSIYFKDQANKEHRLFLDGTIFLNDMVINSITLSGEEFNSVEYEAILDILKAISSHTNGYILFANDAKVGRIKNGVIDYDKTLMKELYDIAPEVRTEEHEEIFQWLLEFENEEKK